MPLPATGNERDKEERCEIIHCGGGSRPATSWNVVAAWEEGDKELRREKTHCGGGSHYVTRICREKIVGSEDFASYPGLFLYVLVRSSFSPPGFFLPSAQSFLYVCIVIFDTCYP